MVETKEQMESVYRLHIMRKMHGPRHNKIVKAVVRLPGEIGAKDLLVAMLRWKAEQPKEKISIATPMGTVQYPMKDILSFEVKPYQNPSVGERRLLLDDKTCQDILQFK